MPLREKNVNLVFKIVPPILKINNYITHSQLLIYAYKWCKVNFYIHLTLLILSIDVTSKLAMLTWKDPLIAYILNPRIVSWEPLASKSDTYKQ